MLRNRWAGGVMGGPRMSAEVFTQATDALNTAMVAATRRMLDVAPRDAVLVQVAHTLHRSYDAGHLAPIAAAALVRLAEEQAAHAVTRAELAYLRAELAGEVGS